MEIDSADYDTIFVRTQPKGVNEIGGSFLHDSWPRGRTTRVVSRNDSGRRGFKETRKRTRRREDAR